MDANSPNNILTPNLSPESPSNDNTNMVDYRVDTQTNSTRIPLTLIRTRSTPIMLITLYLKEGITRSIHDLEAAATLKELKERIQNILETKVENIELSYNNIIFSNMEENTILYDIFKTSKPAKVNVKLLN